MAIIRYIKYTLVYTITAIILFILKCLERFLPSVYNAMLNKIYENGPQGSILKEDFVSSFKDCKGFEGLIMKIRKYTLYGEATVNQPAPNPAVIQLDGVTQKSLLDFAKPLRPLVVNFGSCT